MSQAAEALTIPKEERLEPEKEAREVAQAIHKIFVRESIFQKTK